MAYVLAQHAKDLIDDMNWMKDLPPFAKEAVRLNLINHLVGFIPYQICLYFSN